MKDLVVIEPSKELCFRRPFNEPRTELLKVTNLKQTRIAFKVRTNSPKQYCVRPNQGFIEPEKTKEISVVLQIMKEEPPLDFRSKDKFLFLTIDPPPDTGLEDLTQLFQTYEDERKNDIDQTKLRCVFLPPVGSEEPEQQTTAVVEPPVVEERPPPPIYQSTSDSPAANPRIIELSTLLQEAQERNRTLLAMKTQLETELQSMAIQRKGEETIGATNNTGFSVQVVALLVVVAFLLGTQLCIFC
eukprot:Lithocolla_globosa_v1_NODE_7521_length_935_cov_37.719318.p1 type:complete len:244 gc:universal NODE_7521_length_935_cov_37.719318:834-103(-)